jgi:hypothetical protein
LAKYNDMGSLVWAKRFLHAGGPSYLIYDWGNIVTDGDENIYATFSCDTTISLGSYNLVSNGVPNAILTKFDSGGSVLWSKIIVDTSIAFFASVDGCGNIWVSGNLQLGTVLIDGHTFSTPSDSKDPAFIAGWAPDGTFMQAITLPTAGDDFNSIASDLKGNIYLCGDYYSGPFNIANTQFPSDTVVLEDLFIVKYTPHICSPLGIPLEEITNDITIFPNPSHDQFTINYPSYLNENVEVQLYNILGQLVYTTQLTSNSTIISTASLNDGMYICKILVQGQGIITKKIQVEK